MLLPSQLMVEVAGFGAMTLGGAPTFPAKDIRRDALADEPGHHRRRHVAARPEGLRAPWSTRPRRASTWTPTSGATKGSEVVLIPAGNQHLDGASAAVYAGFLGAGEPEQSRLARLDSVLWPRSWHADDPADADQVAPSARLGVEPLRAPCPDASPPPRPSDRQSSRSVHRTLPIRAIDAGRPRPRSPSTRRRAPCSDDLLASSRAAKRPGGDVRVLVQNGVGTPGLAARRARDRLVGRRLHLRPRGQRLVLRQRPLGRPDHRATPRTSARRGQAVVKALGPPDSALRVTSQGQSIADVVVVLGKDYKPYPLPTDGQSAANGSYGAGVRPLGVLFSVRKAWS